MVDAIEWGPVGERAVALRRNMACSPCYLARIEDCPRGLACLRGLEPMMVHAVSEAMLVRPVQPLKNEALPHVDWRARMRAAKAAAEAAAAEAAAEAARAEQRAATADEAPAKGRRRGKAAAVTPSDDTPEVAADAVEQVPPEAQAGKSRRRGKSKVDA